MIVDNLNKRNVKVSEEQLNKYKKNAAILEDLSRKANNTSKNNVYVEDKFTTDKGEGKKNIILKYYLQDGKYKSEEYHEGELAYIQGYNKDTDTYYMNDKVNDSYKKVTKYSLKNKGTYPGKWGYFLATMEIGCVIKYSTIKEIDYQGKKVMYMDDSSDESGVVHKFWIEKETGRVVRKEEISKNGKVTEEITFKDNQKFSEDTFKDEKNKK